MKFSVQRALTRAPKRRRWNETRACYWCGRAVSYNGRKSFPARATREHIVPKSRGGGDGGNRVVSCYRCNNRRGVDMTWVPFHKLPADVRRRGQPMRLVGDELELALGGWVR